MPAVPHTDPLIDALHRFLALEAPFLEPIPDFGSVPELEALLLARLAHRFDSSEAMGRQEIHPGLTISEASASERRHYETAIRGFFRRQELRQQLTDAERLEMLRGMLLTRAVDEELKLAFDSKSIKWNDYPSPQKGFRSRGQEAIVGAAIPLRRPPEYPPGRDYRGDVIAPLIRDLGALLMFHPDPLHPLLVQYGKEGTPVGGRDLHTGNLDYGVLPPAAPLTIAAQTVAGIAHAMQQRGEDRVCVTFIGDGGSSLGEWHETINLAATRSLPVVFVIENNQWALGTHVSEQSRARRFAEKGRGYGVAACTLFGNDPEEVAAGIGWGAERARAGHGPTLLEFVTYRRPGHAHHDDDRFHGVPESKIPGYEFEDERTRWEAADPIDFYTSRLLAHGVTDPSRLEAMQQEISAEVAAAVATAEEAPWPKPDRYRSAVFAERHPPAAPPSRARKTRRMSYDEAVRQGILELMEEDPETFVIGEDVGGRYGGAFGVTRGLAKTFGDSRCFNAPIAEAAIVGCGVGAAIAGMKPIVEMQFADFLASGFNALVNNAPKVHWRWGRSVPMVVRLPYGGATGTGERLLGGGPYHSQCPEMWFVRCPGWKIVAPSTPADAKGLLIAAVRDPNPVLFLEAKGLYGFFRTDLREEVPLGPEHEVPIGTAAVRRAGTDLTLLTYGAMTWTARNAADTLAAEGIEVEVIDLRSLVPLDWEAIRTSVIKTHRVLILHEDTGRGGFGGELAARVADELFFYLDAPIRRVTAPDTPIPYSPPLEYDFLPKAEDVVAAARQLVAE